MLCKKTVKNQITLPGKVLDQFKGVEYFDAVSEGGKIILTPVTISPYSGDRLEQIRDKISRLGIKESDVEYIVRSQRKKKR